MKVRSLDLEAEGYFLVKKVDLVRDRTAPRTR